MLGVVIFAARCKQPPGGNTATAQYDRTALLTNMADNYIVPAYTNFENKVMTLDASVVQFNTTTDVSNLSIMRSAWQEALMAWQGVSMINVGPGALIVQRSQFNIYPIDTIQINGNITSGGYDLGTAVNLAAKGFQAFDYLLYGIGTSDASIISQYTVDAEASQRLVYLSDISTDMKSYAQSILADWTGSYRDSFVANGSDNSAGSSMSLLVNAYIEHFEVYVRKSKIGLPAGIFNVFSGTPLPSHVESFYSNQSLPYLIKALEKHQAYFNGTSFDGSTNGSGLDDYLLFLGSTTGGLPMQVVINNQFNTAITDVQGLSDPFRNEVTVNQTACTATYTEIQKIVAYLKTDMVAELSIQISYADGDGD